MKYFLEALYSHIIYIRLKLGKEPQAHGCALVSWDLLTKLSLWAALPVDPQSAPRKPYCKADVCMSFWCKNKEARWFLMTFGTIC